MSILSKIPKKYQGLTAGAIGGAISTAVVMPIDTISDTQKQWRNTKNEPDLNRISKSFFATAKELAKPKVREGAEGGIKPFYAGAAGKLMKVVPASAISWDASQRVLAHMKKAEKENKMTKANYIMEKIAKTYPMSRAYETYENVGTGGAYGWLQNRALQGRKNIDATPMSESEAKVMSKIKKDSSGSHDVARVLTSPAMGAALAGTVYGALGSAHGAPGAVAGALYGAGAGAVGSAAGRWMHSRALLGRAEKGRKGFGMKEKQLLKQIKESKND